MSLFCCPVCGEPLERGKQGYRCTNGHSFDMAREGYVHLLPANRMHSKAPGDDKGMAAARNRFLSGDWYAPLKDALCKLTLDYTAELPNPAILDAGCGEGYYTAGLWKALTEAGKKPGLAGVDLSKPSVRKASRRLPEAELAVASVYHLPVADHCVDLLVDCFSPLASEEFRRVLRPGGVFLYVVPGAEHLWELKQVLYDQPYPNREESIPYEGFEELNVVPVDTMMKLPDARTLSDLFQMTPYYWKTPKEGAARLAALEGLDVRASFRIHVFRSEG